MIDLVVPVQLAIHQLRLNLVKPVSAPNAQHQELSLLVPKVPPLSVSAKAKQPLARRPVPRKRRKMGVKGVPFKKFLMRLMTRMGLIQMQNTQRGNYES